MNKLKLYCGQDAHGVWKASKRLEALHNFTNIFSSDIDEARLQNNTVRMIVGYYGHGTCWSLSFDTVLYCTVDDAKHDADYAALQKVAEHHPDKYSVTPISISSVNKGKAFEVGDTTKNGFQWRVIDVELI